MSPSTGPLAPEALLAQAHALLERGGYKVVREAEETLGIPSERGFLAEDKYGVVAVAVYETWKDLSAGWPETQSALVAVISREFTRAEAKAWEGYLVLLTPASLGPEAREEADRIRYDTSRIRKLVASGEDLTTLSDVDRVLLPLLPLEPAEVAMEDESSLLGSLPELLAQQGIGRDAADGVVGAFRRREPLLEALHQRLEGSR